MDYNGCLDNYQGVCTSLQLLLQVGSGVNCGDCSARHSGKSDTGPGSLALRGKV